LVREEAEKSGPILVRVALYSGDTLVKGVGLEAGSRSMPHLGSKMVLMKVQYSLLKVKGVSCHSFYEPRKDYLGGAFCGWDPR
jgi:hypothetical protein